MWRSLLPLVLQLQLPHSRLREVGTAPAREHPSRQAGCGSKLGMGSATLKAEAEKLLQWKEQ